MDKEANYWCLSDKKKSINNKKKKKKKKKKKAFSGALVTAI